MTPESWSDRRCGLDGKQLTVEHNVSVFSSNRGVACTAAAE